MLDPPVTRSRQLLLAGSGVLSKGSYALPVPAPGDAERVLAARERLRFRVFSAARDVALGTRLFRLNFQLHEPEISVNVYSRHVDVNVCLNEAQLRLLPKTERSRELEHFTRELQSGIERLAASVQLVFTLEKPQFGGSEAIMAGENAIGYHAVLLRPNPD